MRMVMIVRSIPSALVLVGQSNLDSTAACAAFLPMTSSDPNCLAEITRHSIILTDVSVVAPLHLRVSVLVNP